MEVDRTETRDVMPFDPEQGRRLIEIYPSGPAQGMSCPADRNANRAMPRCRWNIPGPPTMNNRQRRHSPFPHQNAVGP